MIAYKIICRNFTDAAFEAARGTLRRHPRLRQLLLPLVLRFTPLMRLHPDRIVPQDYMRWIASYDTLTDTDRQTIRTEVATLINPPLISVIMPAYNTPARLLREAIHSVQAQLYPHWELCIADDASTTPHVAEILTEFAAADPRIHWVRREQTGHISAASNSALSLASGEWVALMDHDDLLAEHALYEVAAEAAAWPETQVIYSDEDKVDEAGRRFDPNFKPDFDPDLLLAQNFVSHLGAYRRDLLTRIGGMREGLEGSQDHDLILRASAVIAPEKIRHIPKILYHWRRGTATISFSEGSLERCIQASARAVADHLVGTNASAKVEQAALAPMHLRVLYSVPAPEPMVSVIVPTKDRCDLLRVCLDGVLSGTDYGNMEIIVVDNGSIEIQTVRYLEKIATDSRIRILPSPGPFNFSRLNNHAADIAKGSVLILLNNDVKVIDRNWMREMVSHAIRPGIGAVGAKLLFPDGTLQHAGIVLGAGEKHGVAASCYPHAKRFSPGPFGALALVRSTSAVTAACLAVARESYLRVGGFDEEELPVAYNDVDFCLRLRKAGFRNIWTPYAEMVHFESKSRGDDLSGEKSERFAREIETMRRRWGKILNEDPYWNPNLSLSDLRRKLAFPPRARKRWRAGDSPKNS